MYTNGFHTFLIPRPLYTENYWGFKRAFAYVDCIYCYHPSCCSVTQSCLTLCNPIDWNMPGFPVLYHLLEFAQTHVHWEMPSNHLILSHPLLFLSSIFPSIRIFSNESALCIRWPKYWSFSFSISPSNGYSQLISLRIDPIRN